jgi:hypothetical protein
MPTKLPAKNGQVRPAQKPDDKASSGKSSSIKPGFKVRTSDDLQLLSMILDENPALRQKVLRYVEMQLGKKERLNAKDEDL